jgi:hypothetical protein
LSQSRKKALALICAVWGTQFMGFFSRYSLPTLLAPNNLPKVADDYDVTLLLYTTVPDFQSAKHQACFREIARFASVEPLFIEDFPKDTPRGHWTYWQHAVTEFADRYFAFVVMIPDCLYANDSLSRIAQALEEHSFVYYSLPQVCLELIVPEIDRELGKQTSARYLELSQEAILELLVRYLNPKHAVAIHRPDFFISHPEYLIQLGAGQFAVTEFSSHPLALRSGVPNLSYTFNPTSPGPDVGFLEILGISCESTFKFIEQYYRWPALLLEPSRYVNLASWSYTFRGHGSNAYSQTETKVSLSGFRAISQQRVRVANPRVRCIAELMDLAGMLFRLYELSGLACHNEVRRCICLAMCLPGVRKRVPDRPVTVILPTSDHAAKILQAIQASGNQDLFWRFCAMHVIRGMLELKQGQTFRLWSPKHRPKDGGRIQVTDAALVTASETSATGILSSRPFYLGDDIIVYMADVSYGDIEGFVRSLGGA